MRLSALLLSVLITASGSLHGAQEPMTAALAEHYEAQLLRQPGKGLALERVVEWYRAQPEGVAGLAQRWASDGSGKHLLLQGLLAEHLGEWDQARHFYQEALPGEQGLAAVRLLAAIEMEHNRIDAAISAYDAFLAVPKLGVEARLQALRAVARLEAYALEGKKAALRWEEILRLQKPKPAVLAEAGQALLAAAHPDRAAEVFLTLEAEGGEEYRFIAPLQRARAVLLSKGREEALAIYETLMDAPNPPPWLSLYLHRAIEATVREQGSNNLLIDTYRRRALARPGDPSAWLDLARVQRAYARITDVLGTLEKAASIAPSNVPLQLEYFYELDAQGKYSEALTRAQALSKTGNTTAELALFLGNLQWKMAVEMGYHELREPALESWARIAPEGSKNAADLTRLAHLLTAKGARKEAIAAWKRLQPLAPADVTVRYQLARLLMAEGHQEEARAALGTPSAPEASPEEWLAQAQAQQSMQWPHDASQTFVKALAAHPENPQLLRNAWLHARQIEDEREASKLYPRLFAITPTRRYADLLEQMMVRIGTPPETFAQCQKRFRPDVATPSGAFLSFYLALKTQDQAGTTEGMAAIRAVGTKEQILQAELDLAMQQGDVDAKIAALEALASQSPTQAEVLRLEAVQLLATQRRYPEALVKLRRLLAGNAADPFLHGLHYRIAWLDGKPQEAISELRSAILTTVDATMLRVALAAIYLNRDEPKEAARVLTAALEKEPRQAVRLELLRSHLALAKEGNQLNAFLASLREAYPLISGDLFPAEVAFLMGDEVTASERLSLYFLNHPNDATAIRNLLTLTQRQNQQQESAQLSAHLAAVAPNSKNLAEAFLSIFKTQGLEPALHFLGGHHAAIVADPQPWIAAINQTEGFRASLLRQALLEVLTPSLYLPTTQLAAAQLHLANNEFDQAERLLWSVFNQGDLKTAMRDLGIQSTRANPGQQNRVTPGEDLRNYLSRIANHSRALLRSPGYLYMFCSGGLVFWEPDFLSPPLVHPTTAEALPPLQALFMLAEIHKMRNGTAAFVQACRDRFEAAGLSDVERFQLAVVMENRAETGAIVARIAKGNDPLADAALAPAILAVYPQRPLTPDERTIFERRLAADATLEFDYQLLLARKAAGGDEPVPMTRRQKQAAKDAAEKLLNNPARTPANTWGVLYLAALSDDADLVLRVYREADQHTQDATRQAVLRVLILAGHPEAAAMLEKELAHLAKRPRAPFESALLPQTLYQSLVRADGWQDEAQKVRQWFATQAKGQEALTPFRLGVLYGEMQADPDPLRRLPVGRGHANQGEEIPNARLGSRPLAALKTIEGFHAAKPTVETGRLLYTLYQSLNRSGEMLALLEFLPLEPGETPIDRALARLALLMNTGERTSASALAMQLVGVPVNERERQTVRNALRWLGIGVDYPAGLVHRNSLSEPDPSRLLSRGLRDLRRKGKEAEALKVATGILHGALPNRSRCCIRPMRSAALGELRAMNGLPAYVESLRTSRVDPQARLDNAVRLFEVAAVGDQPGEFDREALFDAIRKHPASSYQYIDFLLSLSNRPPWVDEVLPELLLTLIDSHPSWLATVDPSLDVFLARVDSPEVLLRIAEAVERLTPEALTSLFLAKRFRGEEAPMVSVLSQLADIAAKSGRTKLAISLLNHLKPSQGHLGGEREALPLLALAELEAKQGDRAAAAATLRRLLPEPPALVRFGRGPNLSDTLLGLLPEEPSRAQPATDLFARFAVLAEAVGLLDEVKAHLQKENRAQTYLLDILLTKQAGKPISPAQWKALENEEELPDLLFNTSFFVYFMDAVKEEKAAAGLVTRYMGKVKRYYGFAGAHSFAEFSRFLTLMEPYRNLPEVQAFIKERSENLFFQARAAGDYLLLGSEYCELVRTFLELKREDEARRFYELFTKVLEEESHDVPPHWVMTHARLQALMGKAAPEIVAVPTRGEGSTLELTWSSGLALENGSQTNPVTTNLNLHPSGKKLRELEFYIGPNVASLNRIASYANPAVSGKLSTPAPGPFGVIQARWTLEDGTRQAGKLVPFVSGEPVDTGVPIPPRFAQGDYRLNQPGPFGPTSATTFSKLSPRREMQVPLVRLKWTPEPTAYVITGWVRYPEGGTVPESLATSHYRPNGVSRLDYGFGNPVPGVWSPFVVTIHNTRDHVFNLRVSEQYTESEIALNVPELTGAGGQRLYEVSWAGLNVVRVPVEMLPRQSGHELGEHRRLLNRNEFAEANGYLLKILRQHPQRFLRDHSPRDTFRDLIHRKDPMGPYFALLNEPALYTPDPIHQYRVTVSEPYFLKVLIDEAIKPTAVPEAKEWLSVMETYSGNHAALEIIRSESLLAQSGKKATPQMAEAAMARLGFTAKGASSLNEIRQVWGQEQAQKLLELAATEPKTALAILKATPDQPETRALRAYVEAVIRSGDDPDAALTLWNDAITLRLDRQLASVPILYDQEEALARKLIVRDIEPERFVPVLDHWLRLRGANASGRIPVFRHAVSNACKYQGFYRKEWAEAVIPDMMRSVANTQIDGPGLVEAAAYLAQTGQQARLDALLDYVKTNRLLNEWGMREYYARALGQAKVAAGDYSGGWPIFWIEKGRTGEALQLRWQWSVRPEAAMNGALSANTDLTQKVAGAALAGQEKVELLFGEMPGTMKPIEQVEGGVMEGVFNVQTPKTFGFFQLVATVKERRVSGPIVPFAPGAKVFPPDDLLPIFTSGQTPLPEGVAVRESELAPDGSPIYRFETETDRVYHKYSGPDVALPSSEFYLLQGWVRPSRRGNVVPRLTFKDAEGKRLRDVTLTAQPLSPGQWTFAQQLVRFSSDDLKGRKVGHVMPSFYQTSPGASMAGLELIPLPVGPFTQWYEALDAATRKAEAKATPEEVAAIMELVATDPAMALLAFEGRLTKLLLREKRFGELLGLYEALLKRQVIPLFAQRQTSDFVRALRNIGNHKAVETKDQIAALRLALALIGNWREPVWRQLQYAIMLKTPASEQAALKESLRGTLRAILDGAYEGNVNIFSIFLSPEDQPKARPPVIMLRMVFEVRDETILRSLIKYFKEEDGGHDKFRNHFVCMALEAGLPGAKPGSAEWKKQVQEGFAITTRKYDQNLHYWPGQLEEALLLFGAPKEAVRYLNEERLKWEGARPVRFDKDIAVYIDTVSSLARSAKAANALETLNPAVAVLERKLTEFGKPPVNWVVEEALAFLEELRTLGAPEQVKAFHRAMVPMITGLPAKMQERFTRYADGGSPVAVQEKDPSNASR